MVYTSTIHSGEKIEKFRVNFTNEGKKEVKLGKVKQKRNMQFEQKDQGYQIIVLKLRKLKD